MNGTIAAAFVGALIGGFITQQTMRTDCPTPVTISTESSVETYEKVMAEAERLCKSQDGDRLTTSLTSTQERMFKCWKQSNQIDFWYFETLEQFVKGKKL